MLVLVDTKANSNKFYSLELDQTGRVSKTYGRIGADGVTNYEHTGDSGFQKILDAKKRKGYKEVDVADASSQPIRPRLDRSRLASVARAGLVSEDAVNDTLVADVIERIIKVNAHDILESSGGLIKVDLNGRIQTPSASSPSGASPRPHASSTSSSTPPAPRTTPSSSST